MLLQIAISCPLYLSTWNDVAISAKIKPLHFLILFEKHGGYLKTGLLLTFLNTQEMQLTTDKKLKMGLASSRTEMLQQNNLGCWVQEVGSS